jgi:hypothetical protein
MSLEMKKIKEVVYDRIRLDATIISLLGGDATGRVSWHYLPSNPLYPSIIYRRLTTIQNTNLDIKSLKDSMSFGIDIYDDTPSPETVDDIKERIRDLFQDETAALNSLAVDGTGKPLIHFYVSEVIDDIGDAFLDTQDRWFTSMRVDFKVQLVCENS